MADADVRKIKRASRDAVAKLRLDGTPTPRSWVARMTKRSAPTGAGKSASSTEALKRELHAQVLLPPLHRRSRVRVIESRPPRRRRPLLHGRRQIIGHDSGQSRSTRWVHPARLG